MTLFYLTNLFHILFKKIKLNRFRVFLTYATLIINSIIHHKIKKRKLNVNGQHEETILGYKILFFNYSQLLFLFEEIFIFDTYFFEAKSVSPKIVDGGSNIGLSILYFKKLYPLSEIYSFEPDQVLYATLVSNITNNKIQGVVPNCLALADQNSIRLLYKQSDMPGSLNATLQNPNNSKFKATSISAVRLSDFITDLQIDLIKLDIEGGEIEVVDDLLKSNALESVEQLIIEFHNLKNSGADTKIEQLVQRGYVATEYSSRYCASNDIVVRFKRNT